MSPGMGVLSLLLMLDVSYLAVFPAYAGVILSAPMRTNQTKSFPRVCGGDPAFTKQPPFSVEFSPRMRG